jgi:hypothetical protein
MTQYVKLINDGEEFHQNYVEVIFHHGEEDTWPELLESFMKGLVALGYVIDSEQVQAILEAAALPTFDVGGEYEDN